MGNFRTKEDDVAKISTSIFVSNFPEVFSAKDLFHACKQYGHVVDSFIPSKRSKDGKRFGFVRFINVFSVERLVTLDCESVPSIVLDDDCLNSRDLSKTLLGRIKELASLSNLKKVLKNEGFDEIKLQYMGELWVLLEFPSAKIKELFQENRGAGSWGGRILDTEDQEEDGFYTKRLCIYSKLENNIYENFKVIFRGKVFVLRAKEIPGWVPEFVDELDDDDESVEGSKGDTANSHDGINFDDVDDVDKVPETELDETLEQNKSPSEDPFGIYSILNKNKDNDANISVSDQSIKFPPGFTPNGVSMQEDIGRNVNDVTSPKRIVEEEQNEQEWNNANKGSKDEMSGSVCSGLFKKSVAPQSGGSILCVLEELVKVGQAMGYNMKGLAQKAKKDWVKELCLKNKVNFLALQETKMENMNLWCVKACWGNYTFDYAHSDSVGNSGGILCIWDPNSFHKDNVTVSDFFIIIRGTWLKSGVNILMVAVYAPHDLRDKRILWDYLEYVINRWDGEVIIMGDFNEVRRKSERFGSAFNVQGADMFNTFIANAGLEEIPLGGSSFTWCHKSATKMSKLDRFLISENLFNSFLDICAISLDRFLSDHRPILLRESNHDYGKIPFRYFNHWAELDGFNTFVTDTWNSAPVESNAMRNVMQKFKFLKGKIREWLKVNKSKNIYNSGILKEEIKKIDAEIDNGLASDTTINRRMEVLNSIQHLDKIQAMDIGQKAKVKWAIEGDENSRYFHGILNKKRSQSNIRGIMVDGKWQDNPKVIKSEFFLHFRKRFEKPSDNRIFLDMNFPKTISLDQQTELESAVSKEEVKKAVVLGDNVNEVQSAFISDRQILDGPFILNEVIQWFFVGQWCDDNINTLVHVLECFFRASGLRINMCKSKIMGVNVGDDKIKAAALKLGCRILNTPFTYLGTKVGGNMSRVQAWTEIVDKVKSRLSKWKIKSLSIGGRLTLLKSVLGSIPIFHMSIFKVPLTVLRSLESIRCKFFNGHELKSRKFHSHNDSLWSRVIKAIYGEDGAIDKVYKSASRSCWRDILNEVRKLKVQGINMRDFMYIKVGNGVSTRLDWQQGFEALMWFWSLEGSGEFSVASIRRLIDDQRLLTVDSKTLWIKSVPLKVNILAWKIKLEALPMRFNISRRGIEIDSILCPLCDCGVESARHIFFSCCLVRQIARKVCSWWNIAYSDVNSFIE
ncbi:RNA-directed DNA polymerase, eukaryota [Tanacetum coccineum]